LKVTPTAIPDVLVIEPKVFGDSRGFFYESFNLKAFNDATGLNETFVQDNHSRSVKGVLRGLHYQLQQPWVPAGFAHGVLVLSETAEYYAPKFERCIAWNDQHIGIRWQDAGTQPSLSPKDAQGLLLPQAEVFS
jgi:dTDP-4-dehydrorhamnose 3,5-epimerase